MATVFGIDPSLSATGVATVDELFTVHTKAGDDDRLHVIYDAVRCTTDHGAGDRLAVIEDLPTHAHGAGLTGMAQGVVRLALWHADCPFVVVPAATLKKYATGRGDATKADMRMAWFQRTGQDVRDDNQVDAAWLRQVGLALAGEQAIPLPQAQRGALAKLRLPERTT